MPINHKSSRKAKGGNAKISVRRDLRKPGVGRGRKGPRSPAGLDHRTLTTERVHSMGRVAGKTGKPSKMVRYMRTVDTGPGLGAGSAATQGIRSGWNICDIRAALRTAHTVPDSRTREGYSRTHSWQFGRAFLPSDVIIAVRPCYFPVGILSFHHFLEGDRRLFVHMNTFSAPCVFLVKLLSHFCLLPFEFYSAL